MAKKSTSILQEAIADAKAVRETALANARLVLEEAFTPHLTSMLSAKLRSEDQAGDTGLEGDGSGGEYTPTGVSIEEDMSLSSSDIGGPLNVDSPKPKEPAASAETSSKIPNKGQEFEDEFGNTPKITEAGEVPPIGGPDKPDQDGGFDDHDGDNEYASGDLDLEAIIRELEGDAQPDEFGAEDQTQNPAGEVPPAGASSTDGQPAVGTAPQGTDPKSAPQAPAGPMDGDDDASADDNEDDEKKELNLESILREMDEEVMASEAVEENVSLKKSLSETVGELKEYRQAVQILRSKLQEVNLLNAKLLYTNKLFKNYNMSGAQKMTVVETFDRTNTLREIKLVFSTLAESFNTAGSVTKKKNLTEGRASKPVASTKPATVVTEASEPTVITEGSEMASRFRKLAGIKPASK